MAILTGLYIGGKIIALPLQIVSGAITVGETLIKVATVVAKVAWEALKLLGKGAYYLGVASKTFFLGTVSVVQAHPALATTTLFLSIAIGIVFFFKNELFTFAQDRLHIRRFSQSSNASSPSGSVITPLAKPKILIGYGEYGVPIYK